MKAGDLVKVKDYVAMGNNYLQGIAGWEGLLIDTKGSNQEANVRCVVLIKGKTHWVWMHDLELL